jgi:branched-chain amino acid transport system ATP-binding protein
MNTLTHMDTPPLVDARGLHTYYGNSHVLHGVDLTIRSGESICLLGRNGMGKTTTIRSILGLTPFREGMVKVRGIDPPVDSTRNWLCARGKGDVPQPDRA